ITGPTGTGKSTFINHICGSKLPVGDTLHSCTQQVMVASCEISGQKIVFIDTPGFDDTERSRTDILMDIAVFLEQTYEKGRMLDGLIYMHRISDIRVSGITRENFEIFSKICGNNAMEILSIVTTMWEDVTEEKGAARERELASKVIFFKDAIDQGAQMKRHHNTKESAIAITETILGTSRTPHVLQLQREIVDDRMELPQTAAGTQLHTDLEREMQELRATKERMEKEMEE
ncbi:hypothetical protein WOLCODRAFT_51809, partial [Wolfiporia cocos MD-104 SS10]